MKYRTRVNADGSIDYSWEYDNEEEAKAKFQNLLGLTEQGVYSKCRLLSAPEDKLWWAQAKLWWVQAFKAK